MRKKDKLVYGWGINDVDYPVTKWDTLNGKTKNTWICPYYKDWFSMIQRCYDSKYQDSRPTYKDCTIDLEWKYLSNFIKWVDSQPNRDWKNCQLDKDFLVEGNKHYSPTTCVYIHHKVNSFINTHANARGGCMLGVTYKPKVSTSNPYQASCKVTEFLNSSKNTYLGLFPTELEAHKAWQAKKHEYALRLAEEQQDPRVGKILQERYAPDKDWTKV